MAPHLMLYMMLRCQPKQRQDTLQMCNATPKGFEPLRAEPNGFLVHLLSHSDTASCVPIKTTGCTGVIAPAREGSEASARATAPRCLRRQAAPAPTRRQVRRAARSQCILRNRRPGCTREDLRGAAGLKSDGQREIRVFSGKTCGRRARRRAFRGVFVEDVSSGRKEVYQFCFFCQQRLPQDDCARQRT